MSVDGDVLRGLTEHSVDLGRGLRAAIETGAGEAGIGKRAFRLKRPRGAEPYLVVVSSIAAPASRVSWRASGERLAVLFARDPDHAQETRVELLQRLYGLTGREARLT